MAESPGVGESHGLRQRRQMVLDDVRRAEAALALAAGSHEILGRVGDDFWQGLKDVRSGLELSLQNASSVTGGGVDPPDSFEAWLAFADQRRVAYGYVMQCLALAQGAFVRGAGLDSGACAVADALLKELDVRADVSWHRFTVMADEDAFESADEVTRVRFPGGDVWSLPVSVHEFGHFAMSRLDVRGQNRMRQQIFPAFLQTVEEDLGRQGRTLDAARRRHYEEFFADAFATYALGPAYACTLVRLRLDPFSAAEESSTHPSALRRAHVVLTLLSRMSEQDIGRFGGIPDRLQREWTTSVSEAGSTAPIDDAVLTGMAHTFLDRLRVSRPRLEYSTWAVAQELKSALLHEPSPPESAALADVVNTAWLARLSGHDVGDGAWHWCQAIAARRNPPVNRHV